MRKGGGEIGEQRKGRVEEDVWKGGEEKESRER